MITISLCMIVKNEEDYLRNCLESIKDLVDEIIIVDTGSTDNTKEIILEYTDKLYPFTWINDFSAARNYAFSLATCDYILWLDADDILLEKDQHLFKNMKSTLLPKVDYLSMIYDITFDTKGNCTLSVPRDKLIKNRQGFYWRYFVHEELVVWGDSINTDIHITHTSDHGHYARYLKNYETRLADGYSLLPREKYFYGGELFMDNQYEKCIEQLTDFMQTDFHGNYEKLRSCEYISDCYDKLNLNEKSLEYAFLTLQFNIPSEQQLYKIANIFHKMSMYNEAIYWYQMIKSQTLQVPVYLQLCLCYYALNDLEMSKFYNNKVLSLNPNDNAAIFNNNFFKTLSTKNNEL